MKAVIQRVTRAEVRVEGTLWAAVGPGALVLVGVSRDDDDSCARRLARRVATTRLFEDARGKMGRSLAEGDRREVLAISQITLCGEVAPSGRISFDGAARAEAGRARFDRFVGELHALGIAVKTGRFGARMEVELVNDGPVTWVLEERVDPRGGEGPESSQVFP